MAKSFTPKDCHAIMQLLVEQATGQKNLTITNTADFVSAGEKVMATGMENVMNSLSIVMGKLLIASRPYTAKLSLIDAIDTAMYTNRVRKISFYAQETLESGNLNTDLHTNLKTGYDNNSNAGQSTGSQWEQHQAMPVELNYGGSSVWQDSLTIYDYQVKVAFRDEAEFAKFMAGALQEKYNDIESQKEAFNRLAILNHMGAVYDVNAEGSVKNLTALYNAEFGTSYTSEQLRTVHADSFYKFFVATLKTDMDALEKRSAKRHWSIPKIVGGVTYKILRHTPKKNQRLMLYKPLITRAETYVLPAVFNKMYLDIDKQYEGVTGWQVEDSPAINVTPAIPDFDSTSNGLQREGAAVKLDYVVGMLYDQDALMVDYQLEDASSTVREARKHYRNLWWTYVRNVIDDVSENTILYIMKDEAAKK